MEEIVKMYVIDRMSTTEIAKIVQKSVSTVRRLLIREKVKLRTRAEGIRNCKTLGMGRKGKKFVFSAEHKKNISLAKLKSTKYKRKRIAPNGYVRIRIDNKEYDEHRYIMAKELGAQIDKDIVVHHINGDKTDNSKENLQLLTRSEHSSLHRKKKL